MQLLLSVNASVLSSKSFLEIIIDAIRLSVLVNVMSAMFAIKKVKKPRIRTTTTIPTTTTSRTRGRKRKRRE